MLRITSIMLLFAVSVLMLAAHPQIVDQNKQNISRVNTKNQPLKNAEGTNFTLLKVSLADGLISWNTQVVMAKNVPVSSTVMINNKLTTVKTFQNVTVTETKKVEIKLADLEVISKDGKVVSAEEVAKRLKASGTLVLLYNPLDKDTSKFFSDDALFFMPFREKSEDRIAGDNKEWQKLKHEDGVRVSFVGVKTKDGMLNWSEQVLSGNIVTTTENNAKETKVENGAVKFESKQMKLADLKFTNQTGDAVEAADIDKQLKDGGSLVKTISTLSKTERKLFAKEYFFLEPPTADKVEINSGPGIEK